MVIVTKYKNETNLEVIRRFLKAVKDQNLMEEIMERQFYLKPSQRKALVKKRRKNRKGVITE